MENMGLAVATLFYNAIMVVLVILASYWCATSVKKNVGSKYATKAGVTNSPLGRNREYASVLSWTSIIGGMIFLAVVAGFVAVLLSLPYFDPLRAARFLCFGWFIHVPLFVFIVAILVRKRWLWFLVCAIATVVLAIVIFAFCIEPFRLEVSHHQIVTDKISRPVKIGILADFQTDQFEDYERRSLQRFMEERPDLIVMAGDYLQAESEAEWEVLRDTMNEYLKEIGFGAPLGVYGVGGNTDFQRWPEIFGGIKSVTFRDSSTSVVGEIAVTGLSIEDSFDPVLLLRRPDAVGTHSNGFHLVLGHAPDFALSPAVEGDLFVAGHTHGGQVRLPWIGPIVTFSRVPRSWAAGLTQVAEDRWLVVSRGVGMERRDAPRLRFLCRPQLVFIELVPEERLIDEKHR